VLASVLGLELCRFAVDLRGASVNLRLPLVRLGRPCVRGLDCLAVRRTLMRQRSSLALARPLLARAGFAGLI
jgi:hypothetical protein